MTNNQDISWAKFEAEHTNVSEAFQTLVLRMMAYDLEKPSWVFNCPRTFPGVECEPVDINGKFHSLQAKYYSNPNNGWKKLIESLETTCSHIELGTYSLDFCYVYVNWGKPVTKNTGKPKKTPTKIEECNEIAKNGGFKLIWNFGGQIIERLQNDESHIALKLARQFFTFPAQPILDHPDNKGNIGIAKYHYASRSRLDYVERTEVVSALKKLMDDSRQFVWHTVIGSAGVGKSRSILEFCLYNLDQTWTWGWLRPNCSLDFASWQPDSNYVIVVDYAMGRGDQLVQLLNDCVSQENEFLFQVRVVVAERMLEPWMQVITSLQTKGAMISDAALLHDQDNSPRATVIRPFKHDDQLRLARIALEKCPTLKLTDLELVSKILKVDDQFRPLLVWLCAEHLSRGEDLRYAEDLINDYINHQRNKNWLPNNVASLDESNTALVTMCQGLSDSVAGEWSQKAKERVASIDELKHSIILGSEQTGNALRPMEPDIVGELHALNVSIGNNPLDLTKAQNFVDDASLLNSKGFIGFLFRSASDFPAHDAFKKILNVNLNPELKVQIIHYLILGLNKNGPNKDRKRITKLLNQTRKIVQVHPTLQAIRNYSATVTNSSHGFKSPDDIDLIKSHLETVRQVLEQANDPFIFRSYVGAIQNLFAGEQLAPLTYEEKKSYVLDLRGLVKNPGFSQDSFRTFIGILSSQFAKALQQDEFALNSVSQTWLDILEPLLNNKFSEDEHIRSVVASMLKTAAEKMHATQNYEAHSSLVEKIVELVSHLRDQEVTQMASQLFSYCQTIKNGGSANPDANRLLDLLAEKNAHAAILKMHLR